VTFSGYSINGVSLMDRTRGWTTMRAGTNTQGGITKSLQKTPIPGRPGYRPAPSTYTEQTVVFVCRVRRDALDSFLALCAAASVLTQTSDPTKEAYVELVSAIPSGDEPMDGNFDVSVTLNAYEGVWRDVDYLATLMDGSTPIAVDDPVETVHTGPGISAPVFDGDFFFRGVFGQFTLQDSGGSYLKTTRAWPGTADTGILWLGATQQAFLANAASPWTPLSDASQYIDQSGNGGFRIMPSFVGGNPTVREGLLTLTTLTQTSTTLTIRAKRAYRMN
jgi:hypothetical protein